MIIEEATWCWLTNLLCHNEPCPHTIFGNVDLVQSFHIPNRQFQFCVHQCGKYWCIQALHTFWYYGPLHSHKCISLPRCFPVVQCLCIYTGTRTACQHSHSFYLCILLHTWMKNGMWSLTIRSYLYFIELLSTLLLFYSPLRCIIPKVVEFPFDEQPV